MRNLLSVAAVGLFALVAVASPAGAAAPNPTPPPSLVVMDSPGGPYIPEPYVPPIREQFKFLGYKVSAKAVNGKPTKADRAEINRFQSKFGIPQTGRVGKNVVKTLDKYAGDMTLPKRCYTGEFTLCINKFNRTLWAVNPDGSTARVMDTRFGMPGLETREGKFKVQRKGGAHHISTQYQVEMPYPLFFSGGQAVHFSWEFYHRPTTQSHGCIGTRDYDKQKWLWSKSEVGTPVVVFDKPVS